MKGVLVALGIVIAATASLVEAKLVCKDGTPPDVHRECADGSSPHSTATLPNPVSGASFSGTGSSGKSAEMPHAPHLISRMRPASESAEYKPKTAPLKD